jgi:hypothetical protein
VLEQMKLFPIVIQHLKLRRSVPIFSTVFFSRLLNQLILQSKSALFRRSRSYFIGFQRSVLCLLCMLASPFLPFLAIRALYP